MRIKMPVSLDHTLGCGQAHRWRRKDGAWEGVMGDAVVTLSRNDDGFECAGTSDRRMVLDYFRDDDDLPSIYDEISRDPVVSGLVRMYDGLRLLRQEPWECTATYLLATNANVGRIGTMVENVCREFGKDLGGRFSFPGPEDILDGEGDVRNCRLGYRDARLLRLAEAVADGVLDLDGLKTAGYRECIGTLKTADGIGDKVADCIALFSYGHLEAFPIDARIRKRLSAIYGMDGSYAEVSGRAREKFGRYGGYAQEFLYHCQVI